MHFFNLIHITRDSINGPRDLITTRRVLRSEWVPRLAHVAISSRCWLHPERFRSKERGGTRVRFGLRNGSFTDTPLIFLRFRLDVD